MINLNIYLSNYSAQIEKQNNYIIYGFLNRLLRVRSMPLNLTDATGDNAHHVHVIYGPSEILLKCRHCSFKSYGI